MFNLVVLTGRLTADPELKTTPNGVSVTSFSIAVGRRYRSGETPNFRENCRIRYPASPMPTFCAISRTESVVCMSSSRAFSSRKSAR